MISFFEIPSHLLSGTRRLLQAELAKRSWQAETPLFSSPHLFLTRPDGVRLHVFGAVPPTASFAASHLAGNKFYTHMCVEGHGIKQPETMIYDPDKPEEAKEFLKKHGKIVVKPIDASHGHGITIGITEYADLTPAIERAIAVCFTNPRALIQECLSPDLQDTRVLVIDYKVIGAINRVPARVTGDGKHTVAELIPIENNTLRGEPYKAPLAIIPLETALNYLGDKANTIPSKDEKFRVMPLANYGKGGELIDVTDELTAEMRDQAERVAKLIDLPVAGIDFLGDYFIELNACPSLQIHDEPAVGKPRGAVKAYVDYLEKIS